MSKVYLNSLGGWKVMNSLGKEGEMLAKQFLKKKGYSILQENYRTPFGEIDIIAKEKDVLVFVEVKTRTDLAFGSPFEAVNQRKKEKIRKVASSFMKSLKKECPARFGVLGINVEDGREKIRAYKGCV
jgi:putative endonuclease